MITAVILSPFIWIALGGIVHGLLMAIWPRGREWLSDTTQLSTLEKWIFWPMSVAAYVLYYTEKPPAEGAG